MKEEIIIEEEIIGDINMIMFNKLPYFVILQGKKYKINVDYRNMISFENKLQDKSANNSEKIEYGLRHFYPAFFYAENYRKLLQDPKLYKEACEKLIWFYKCGRENYHKKGTGKGVSNQIYSYDYDDEYIYSAFLDKGIDLAYDKVHWWKFRAIFKSLSSECEFSKIMQYRAYTGDDENMLELKSYWELPVSVEEQERLDKLYETLK